MQRRAFYRHTSHERASLVGLSGGPLSWTSLAGLSRGMHLYPPQSLYPVSASEPVSSAPASIPTLEPRRSERTLSIPGHYAVLAGRSPRKPRRGGNV
jgi:hypothetical protein